MARPVERLVYAPGFFGGHEGIQGAVKHPDRGAPEAARQFGIRILLTQAGVELRKVTGRQDATAHGHDRGELRGMFQRQGPCTIAPH
jgi:hypothetical protein